MTDNIVEQQRRHFNEIANKYYLSRQNENHLLLKELIWKEFFSDKQALSNTCKAVLEPMCGLGDGGEILKKQLSIDIDYDGFDYSDEIVRIAKYRHPNANIFMMDATRYEGLNKQYDWIVLIGGLHHVYSQSHDVVFCLSKSLRVGGYFLSFEPTQNCWLTRTIRNYIYNSNDIFDAETEQGFELNSIDEQFISVGFKKIDQVFPGLLSYILFYNPDAFPMLNVGGKWLVRLLFMLDKVIWRAWLAKKISFATITLWQKV